MPRPRRNAVKGSKSAHRSGIPVRAKAVSNLIATLLLVAGIIVGLVIYYGVASTAGTTTTAGSTIVTTTSYLPTTYVSTTTIAGTATPSVSTTTVTTTATLGISTVTVTTTVTPGATTGTASVALGAAECSISGVECMMEAANGGTAAGSITACQIGGLAAKYPSSQEVTVIEAHSTVTLICGFSSMPQGAANGQSVSGTITVDDSLVYWYGTYVP